MPGLVLTYAWLALILASPTAVATAATPTPSAGDGGAPPAVIVVTGATAATGSESGDAVAAQDPEAILHATSRAYEAMRSVRADFEQTLRNTLLGRTTTSSGTLYQREPDRFLMDFSDPEGDVIVSDGRYYWMYYPSVDEKQVLRTPRRGQGLDLQAEFIGDPVERFDYTYHGTEDVRGRTAHVMTLDPKQAAGYRRMKVWIDATDHLVRRFEITEENGNVRQIELLDITVNPTLPDSLFEFTPPEGAMVVERG
ncbi:MAG: LolA family protein [Candidatus Longimicrobiales bacterium M2_2A_002]